MQREGICVAGSIIADCFYEVDTYPDEGFLSVVRSSAVHIGGSGNLILDLSKLDADLNVKICAVVGKDDKGSELLKSLKMYTNIDISDVFCEGESSVTLVMNANDSKQRTFFYIPGASDVFDESYIKWDNIRSKIFHLEYLLLMKKVDSPDAEYGTHGARILAEAKKRGMITSFDMVSEQSDRVSEVIRPALKFTDICCINESEAEAVTGIRISNGGVVSDERAYEALYALRELGVSRWIVIHSPARSYGLDVMENRTVCVHSLKLPSGYIKGTTGAGDAFCSGILYGAHSEYSIDEAMRLAVACAASSLSENNGTDGMRTKDEVLSLYDIYES